MGVMHRFQQDARGGDQAAELGLPDLQDGGVAAAAQEDAADDQGAGPEPRAGHGGAAHRKTGRGGGPLSPLTHS